MREVPLVCKAKIGPRCFSCRTTFVVCLCGLNTAGTGVFQVCCVMKSVVPRWCKWQLRALLTDGGRHALAAAGGSLPCLGTIASAWLPSQTRQCLLLAGQNCAAHWAYLHSDHSTPNKLCHASHHRLERRESNPALSLTSSHHQRHCLNGKFRRQHRSRHPCASSHTSAVCVP